MKTFTEFLKTETSPSVCDSAFIERLNAAGVMIVSQNDLMKFARERFPDHFHADTRKATTTAFGRTAMQQL